MGNLRYYTPTMPKSNLLHLVVHIFLAPRFAMFSTTSQNLGLPTEHPYLIIGAKEEVWPVIHIKEQNRMTVRTLSANAGNAFLPYEPNPKSGQPSKTLFLQERTPILKTKKISFFAERTQSHFRTPLRLHEFRTPPGGQRPDNPQLPTPTDAT